MFGSTKGIREFFLPFLQMAERPSKNNETMSEETPANAESTNETDSAPDQDWGKIAICVAIAIIAALAIHYVAFEVVITGTNLLPTVHALVGMVLFFFAGFVSFSVFY
jgi:hypothetical protein